MATTYRVLGQQVPATAAAETTLYTVPAATQAIVSTITVANLTAAAVTARINIRPGGTAVADRHALVRDVSIAGNTTLTLTLGLSLAATDVVSVQSGTAGALAFHIYGAEVA